MYKLNFKKRVWIAKQFEGGTSPSKIALAQKIHRSAIYQIVERFFLTYKTEYATGSFANISDFIRHYNEARSHMSLGYKTPKQIWDELKSV